MDRKCINIYFTINFYRMEDLQRENTDKRSHQKRKSNLLNNNLNSISKNKFKKKNPDKSIFGFDDDNDDQFTSIPFIKKRSKSKRLRSKSKSKSKSKLN